MSQPIKRSVLLKRVKTAVHALSPAAEIILYGSQARGTARADSDWDFLILLPSAGDKMLEAQIKDCLYDIELETDTVLSSIIRSKQEWMSERYAVIPLRQQVESYGVARMKAEDLQALIAYRLKRATESLEEARLMQNIGHWNTCANRLYYAAFYAVSALLVQGGHAASKHSGVKALFNRHYVKPGIVTKENGRLYNRLFDLRQEGDYIDFVSLDAETASLW